MTNNKVASITHARIVKDGKAWAAEAELRTFDSPREGIYSYGEGNVPLLPIRELRKLRMRTGTTSTPFITYTLSSENLR